ncbi:MAG: PAS domain S-box protein [Clostridia bacterium]|nr:PAS domain S-box protein [Clostridia bacterium]
MNQRMTEVNHDNFKVLFDYAPQGMLTVDKNYKIVNMNAAAADIFFVSVEDSIGKRIGESFGCVNFIGSTEGCSQTEMCESCVFKNAVDNVLIQGIKVNGVEFLFNYKDDDYDTCHVWLKISAVPMVLNDELHALIVIEDVTLNRELAKNLIRNERRLRLITDNMTDTITQVDNQGVIEFVTPSCWTLLGYSPSDVVGKHFMDYVYKDDLMMVESSFRKRLKTRENFTTRIRLIRMDGQTIWVEANGSVVDDENRRRTIVYVIRDVTEEERYKKELEKSKEEAVSASKSKSEFLANMSHEIRTPMNGIIGMTNITLMDKLTDEQRENMTMVKNSAVSLLGIINSILDFSKIEAGKIELEKMEFDLKELVTRTINPLVVIADQKNIEMEVSYASNLQQKLVGDPGRISQILNNLVYNAIKFTEAGGVYVNFATIEMKNELMELRCSVRDTGIGIPKEEQSKMFESFHQVDGSITRKYGGTGLGLAITKGLIRQMDGVIEVNSVLGQGSVFSFSIPMKASNVEKVVNSDRIQIQVPQMDRQLNILLVEDDLVNRKMTRKILEKQNHLVTIATNGKEAVEIFKEANFDLILMDIQMPEMDGIKASKLIKKQCRDRGIYTPIIALTAYAIAGDEERFIEEGMDDYISKPIDLTKFFEVIMRNINHVEGWGKDPNNEIHNILERVTRENKHSRVYLSNDNEADKAFFGRLLKFFRTIEEGLREHNFDTIESAAHRLKTILAEYGYAEERKLTFKLELATRRGDIEKVISLYKELKACFNFER